MALMSRLVPVPSVLPDLPLDVIELGEYPSDTPLWSADEDWPPRVDEDLEILTPPPEYVPSVNDRLGRFSEDRFTAMGGLVQLRGAMVVPGLPPGDAFGSSARRDRVSVSAAVYRISGAIMTGFSLRLILYACPVSGHGAVESLVVVPPFRSGPGVSAIVDAMPGQYVAAELTTPPGGPTVFLVTMSTTTVPVDTMPCAYDIERRH